MVDTNVLVSALLSASGASREMVRRCLRGDTNPIIGQKLFTESEDVMSRETLLKKSPLSKLEREILFDAFLSCCRWVQVYFLWRPNLRDEGDNHVLELAVAGNSDSIVTMNKRDFDYGELSLNVPILTPAEFLKTVR